MTIKKMPRSDARSARAIHHYRQRLATAETVGDIAAAAFDLFRGQVQHAPDDQQRLLTQRLQAFAEDAVSTITKGR